MTRMKTKTRDSGTRREYEVSSLFHRVSPGKWIALVFLWRAMSFATGCSSGPADGTLGGKCKDDGCNTMTCTDGSVCNDARDICVAATPGGDAPSGSTIPDPYAGATCTLGTSTLCFANEVAVYCPTDVSSSFDQTGYVCRYLLPTTEPTLCCRPIDGPCVDAACDDSGIAGDADIDANDGTEDAGSDVSDASDE